MNKINVIEDNIMSYVLECNNSTVALEVFWVDVILIDSLVFLQ